MADIVAEALAAGAPAIQLRDKNATAADLYHQALELQNLTRRYDALLLVNDRLDVALAAGADGVHLGPDDLPIPAARAALRSARLRARRAGRRTAVFGSATPPAFLIGYSTDDPEHARRAARDGADYVGCGALFGTTSKDVGGEHIGTRRLRQVVEAVEIPVVGIGGVSTANVARVAEAGAAGAATISAVMSARDVTDVVKRLLAAFPASSA